MSTNNGDHDELRTAIHDLQKQHEDLRTRLFGFANENWQGGMKGDLLEIRAQLDAVIHSLPNDITAAFLAATAARNAGRWASLGVWGKALIGAVVAGVVVGLLVAVFTVALHLTQVVQVKP